jgi:hypothetical protein
VASFNLGVIVGVIVGVFSGELHGFVIVRHGRHLISAG